MTQQNRPVDTAPFAPTDTFVHRHVGPRAHEVGEMLEVVGCSSLAELVEQTVPTSIISEHGLDFGGDVIATREPGESEVLAELKSMMGNNQLMRSLIGMGYNACLTPAVIMRGILENPGWYTPYTPYQAEIAQGRLEALINFQTVISDLTGLPLAGASLLDEATAAAEAVHMCVAKGRGKRRVVWVSQSCHPQTIAVVQTRAKAQDIEIRVAAVEAFAIDKHTAAVVLQYPTTEGDIHDYSAVAKAAHDAGAQVIAACDLLALTLLRPPGEWGADIAVGSAQRFGVPLGYGGPHAAFLAADTSYKRIMPGRIIGVSRDARGKLAYRMAMQTREQHIRRERATSNICTAQVLLAIVASMYAVYHGPEGLTAIARRVLRLTQLLAEGVSLLGHQRSDCPVFDTVTLTPSGLSADEIHERALAAGFNFRRYADGRVGISLDERSSLEEVERILAVLSPPGRPVLAREKLVSATTGAFTGTHARTSPFLQHEVFANHRAEHELLRYMHRLRSRDLSLTTSMTPLGSCTMKLNATSEMLAISWPEVGDIHPFVPADQAQGYAALVSSLERMLCEVTGFAGISFQPNAGSQGELAGLLTIRAYHEANGQGHRNICLIPTSAHGTNPASAVLAGMKVVAVACDDHGNIDIADLQAKADKYRDKLSAVMVTYPSTHGVFEAEIRKLCEVVHGAGGQVYLDGANLNAQLGVCRPGEYGADVCHLNLHKTFCIPHGGGGPGMGPIGVAPHLLPFLPGHPVVACGGEQAIGAIAAAPFGSASILTISWMYIAMMGAAGLRRATEIAILAANYMAARLEPHFPVLYRGTNGRVAHEFIIDLRPLKKSAGIEVDDVAKRLMDYGFHAPTMSFPVAGTLMIEPTESESKAELDRLCEALISIREEIRAIENGTVGRNNNVLKHAPHTADVVISDSWDRPYPREQAAYPAEWLREHKYWPHVGRIDNAFGDRNLACTCPTVEELAEE